MIEFSKEKTKYKAEFTTRMKKDFKRILKRNYNIEEFVYVVQKLLVLKTYRCFDLKINQPKI